MIYIFGHIIFAIFGISALSKGKASLSKQFEISGAPARLIGIIALLTYPMAWIGGFCFGVYWGMTHPGGEFPLFASFVANFGAFSVVAIAIYLVARKAPKSGPGAAVQPATAPESQPVADEASNPQSELHHR